MANFEVRFVLLVEMLLDYSDKRGEIFLKHLLNCSALSGKESRTCLQFPHHSVGFRNADGLHIPGEVRKIEGKLRIGMETIQTVPAFFDRRLEAIHNRLAVEVGLPF